MIYKHERKSEGSALPEGYGEFADGEFADGEFADGEFADGTSEHGELAG